MDDVTTTVIELMVLKACKQLKGRTRLQKIFFLLKRKYNIPINLEFKPYFYGPYSEELAHDIQVLRGFGIVEEKVVPVNDYVEFVYELTEKGENLLKKLLSNDEYKELYEKISKYVEQYKDINLKDLVYEAKSLS
jgi:uncharacterized protein YwgA